MNNSRTTIARLVVRPSASESVASGRVWILNMFKVLMRPVTTTTGSCDHLQRLRVLARHQAINRATPRKNCCRRSQTGRGSIVKAPPLSQLVCDHLRPFGRTTGCNRHQSPSISSGRRKAFTNATVVVQQTRLEKTVARVSRICSHMLVRVVVRSHARVARVIASGLTPISTVARPIA